ncbi:ABC transporter ATP-binding protein [Microlunatus elymi]|uniref:ABC transporter ATP-binding protein n=1 Tax=Microlunatus elymi TaxID=2596828 RepID=A0A516Q1B5_9ACTN|nr:ABC transporter ATP-binding protein [Microlunatus elymi]QDP97217.1 ABC transporter ATP-binding protein [Microlunatus elymi]
MSLLEVSKLTHRYPSSSSELPALNEVSLAVDADTVTAIVGESGCGKTTLGRVLSGLVKPLAGQVLYDGRDIHQLPRTDWDAYRRNVQIAQQDPYSSLNPGLSVRETLRPGLLRHRIVPRHQVPSEILRLLELVGLDADPRFLRRFPHQLSGGQRQRLAIARAVSLRPQLIVADEPTSMLDVSIRVSVLDLMKRLRTEQGLAYVFISHDFGVVRYIATGGRIVVMFFGEVVEEGPAEEVIRRPQHPYSYLLLESIPVPDPRTARQRRSASVRAVEERVEQPPSATGCIFSNRCPFVEDACRVARPELTEVSPGHRAACLFPERVPQLPQGLQADVTG